MDDGPCAVNFSELVEQHYALVYRYSYRLTGSAADAEDLTQHVYLTAQAKLDQLREKSHAKAWLCTIARNAFLKSVRGRRNATVISLESVAEPTGEIPPETVVDPQELQTVLDELPEEFRTPLILFYFEDFSYREIAEQMDVPIGTIMSRLARAKTYLRRRLLSHQPASHEL